MNIRFILLSLIISNVASFATELDHFGAQLFSTISQQNNDENIFLSPASISLALSMCAVGARHDTLQQMLHVLQVSSIEQLTNVTEQIMQVFPPTQSDVPSMKNPSTESPTITLIRPEVHYFLEDRSSVELKLANRLYVQEQYHIEQQYLDILQKSFQSDIKLEDFKNNSAKAIQTINEWVEKQTNQRIRDILSSKDVTKDTRLVLINSIYFKGQWEDKFKGIDTNKNADFHRTNGMISKIELMHQKNYFNYVENKDLRIQIVHLPYISSKEDERFVFTVVLPNEGVSLDEVEQKLNSNLQLRQQLLSNKNATSSDVLLYLPKFKLETKYELEDTLRKLGMEDAFSDTKADFEGIVGKVTDEDRIRISKVIHKTFLNVNEEGTEAAAATVVTMERVGFAFGEKPKPIEFKADRPFLFFIREATRDLILFSGKLIAP